MSESIDYETIRNVQTRFISLGAVMLVFSLVAFRLSAFDMHSFHFALMVNGMAIALVYATMKSGVFRNRYFARPIMLIFVLVIAQLPLDGWRLASIISYMLTLTAAVSLYCSFSSKHPLRHRISRISMAFLILGLADAFVFFLLEVVAPRMSAHSADLFKSGVRQLTEGLMMTGVSALAIELAESLLHSLGTRPKLID